VGKGLPPGLSPPSIKCTRAVFPGFPAFPPGTPSSHEASPSPGRRLFVACLDRSRVPLHLPAGTPRVGVTGDIPPGPPGGPPEPRKVMAGCRGKPGDTWPHAMGFLRTPRRPSRDFWSPLQHGVWGQLSHSRSPDVTSSRSGGRPGSGVSVGAPRCHRDSCFEPVPPRSPWPGHGR